MERAYHAMLSLGVHHRQRPTVGIDGQVWKLRPLRVVPDVYALAAERPRRVGDVRDDATRAGVGDEVVRLGGPRGGAPVESATLAAPAGPFLRLRLVFVPSHPRGRVLCRVPCWSSRETELVLSEDDQTVRKCSSLRRPLRAARRPWTNDDGGVHRLRNGTRVVEATDSVEGGIRASSRASGDHSPSGPG